VARAVGKVPSPRIERARSLRRAETDPEYRLWYELKAHRLNGYKFVRQLPIGPYFADFACRSHWLIVELDGGQHSESARDARRAKWLNAQGYSVLRFWNDEVMREREAVLETILAVLDGRLRESSDGGATGLARPSGPSPHRGEEWRVLLHRWRMRRILSPNRRAILLPSGEKVARRAG
jgi:very-short-patch-repair endonuclease